MLSEFTKTDFDDALNRVAEQILTSGGCSAPPIRALALADSLGMTVALDRELAGRGRTVRLPQPRGRPPRRAIFVRPEPRAERLHWVVAHEIGEHFAAEVFRRLGVSPHETPPNTREAVANHLASRILLPTIPFFDDARRGGWNLIELKQRYATASHELIARRMLESDLPTIITIFDQGSLTMRQANLPGRAPHLGPAEHTLWQSVHRSALPQVLADARMQVQGWPVHEADWKREILRTECDALWSDDSGDW